MAGQCVDVSDPVDTVGGMEVEVVRSQRRKKTVEARIVGGVLRVSIPAAMTAAEEAHWVDVMRARVQRTQRSRAVDLEERAAALAARLSLPAPAEIVFSKRQRTRWGSCTPGTGRIRISDRIAGFPSWVIDYVIVHELAHLVIPDHSDAFWQLVDRYELAERARGYLAAKSEEQVA